MTDELSSQNGRTLSGVERDVASHERWLQALETFKDDLLGRMAALETVTRRLDALDAKVWALILMHITLLGAIVAFLFKGGK